MQNEDELGYQKSLDRIQQAVGLKSILRDGFTNIRIDGKTDRSEFEPSPEECTALSTQFGLKNFIAGEAAVGVGRLLYHIRHDMVDAIISINPLLCCRM